MEIEIMEEFPLLSSWEDHKYWTGFINCQGLLVRLAFKVPNFPSSTDLLLQGDEDTLDIFNLYQNELQIAVNSNKLVVDVIRGLQSVIEKHKFKEDLQGVKSSTTTGNETEFFMAIFNELEQIGCENVESASPTFQEISLRCFDETNRKHILRFNVSPLYPRVAVKVKAELPFPILDSMSWPNTLLDSYKKFQEEMGKYIKFWNTMDELDSHARVIDPIQPNRSDCFRRILMNQSVVVHLVVNPLSPRGFPEIQFSGPEKNVQELEALLDQDCKNWIETNSILENLEDILQCEFMSRQTDDEMNEVEMVDQEKTCVICYTFEFEGKVPETSCDCGSIYHNKCLSDLLINDCSSKARRLCVDCPVCGVELKVSNPQKASW